MRWVVKEEDWPSLPLEGRPGDLTDLGFCLMAAPAPAPAPAPAAAVVVRGLDNPGLGGVTGIDVLKLPLPSSCKTVSWAKNVFHAASRASVLGVW